MITRLSRGDSQLSRADRAAEKAMIKQLTGTDEAAGRRCLIGLQVVINWLRGADQLNDRYFSSG